MRQYINREYLPFGQLGGWLAQAGVKESELTGAQVRAIDKRLCKWSNGDVDVHDSLGADVVTIMRGDPVYGYYEG